MNSLKLIRNNFALLFLAVLAVSGIAFLVWAAGANVNCIAGTCNSTTGISGAPSTAGLFTNDNDTASIECASGTYSGGGGNDTFYLRDPQTASASVTIRGQDGDDVILDGCTTNNNFLNGVNGNDFIVGGSGNTRLNGDNGNDLLAGGQGVDVLGDSDGNGSCTNESDPGNDVFVGGPGDDEYCTDANDGDDIVIIHAGDVTASETYTCVGSDTILAFGFEQDGVIEVPPAYPLTDPVTGGTYSFSATAPNKCTIIFVE